MLGMWCILSTEPSRAENVSHGGHPLCSTIGMFTISPWHINELLRRPLRFSSPASRSHFVHMNFCKADFENDEV
ncbi:hypothetical protein V1477_005271 [Vespula maculifrons]|uniref:Uncharacterized protein n=1 Tax=Vespula maculifrons TaxID=7453 RepID=A0ABD2CP97_VESMC